RAVHAVRLRRVALQGGTDPGRHARRRHGARPDGQSRSTPALLRSPEGVRAPHGRARTRQHLVQHARRTRRLHTARRDRVLLDVAARRARDRSVPAREAGGTHAMSTPRVSVVIPTYRRPDLLERCLSALCLQTLAAEKFEIVVVHDGPCPKFVAQTSALACTHTASGGPALHAFATRTRRGPAAARNLGIRQAQGELVAFTDDDTIPDSGWLAATVARFAA